MIFDVNYNLTTILSIFNILIKYHQSSSYSQQFRALVFYYEIDNQIVSDSLLDITANYYLPSIILNWNNNNSTQDGVQPKQIRNENYIHAMIFNNISSLKHLPVLYKMVGIKDVTIILITDHCKTSIEVLLKIFKPYLMVHGKIYFIFKDLRKWIASDVYENIEQKFLNLNGKYQNFENFLENRKLNLNGQHFTVFLAFSPPRFSFFYPIRDTTLLIGSAAYYLQEIVKAANITPIIYTNINVQITEILTNYGTSLKFQKAMPIHPQVKTTNVVSEFNRR